MHVKYVVQLQPLSGLLLLELSPHTNKLLKCHLLLWTCSQCFFFLDFFAVCNEMFVQLHANCMFLWTSVKEFINNKTQRRPYFELLRVKLKMAMKESGKWFLHLFRSYRRICLLIYPFPVRLHPGFLGESMRLWKHTWIFVTKIFGCLLPVVTCLLVLLVFLYDTCLPLFPFHFSSLCNFLFCFPSFLFLCLLLDSSFCS